MMIIKLRRLFLFLKVKERKEKNYRGGILMDKRRNIFSGGASVAPIREDSLLGRELFGERRWSYILGRDGDEFLRDDLRYPENIRPFEVDFISGSKIFFQSNGIKLCCSILGPRSAGPRQATGNAISTQTKIGRSFQTLSNLSCEINWAPFSSSLERKGHQPLEEENNVALCLLQALSPVIKREKYPNSFIDIYITILEMNGSILASCITASSIALISSGIEMLDSVIGIDMALIESSTDCPNKTIMMDLTHEEDFLIRKVRTPASFRLTMAVLPNLMLFSQIYGIGSFNSLSSIKEGGDGAANDDGVYLSECISAGLEASKIIYDSLVRPALIGQFSSNN